MPTKADQETKWEKIRKKVVFMKEITNLMFDKSGKALSKNIIPSGTTKRQVIL
jgi:hypothetical protein